MNKDPFHRNHLIRDLIGQALHDEMQEDPAIHLFGEGCEIKMHYDAPQILADFPDRVHTLPISEDGNLNFAVGTSLLGVKPVVDVITADFMYRCFDSICNTAAKLNSVLPHEEEPRTIIVRGEFLTAGPTTGQRPEALFCHIPGLRVVVPSTPRDAYCLMRRALAHPGVTIFFEDRMIPDDGFPPWDITPEFHLEDTGGHHLRKGADQARLTVITYGLMRPVVEEILAREAIDGVDLIDLRVLYPLDWYSPLGLAYLADKTGKVLIVEPDVVHGGVGAEIAATLAEMGISVRRLGAPRGVLPANPQEHHRFRPSEQRILEAIRA